MNRAQKVAGMNLMAGFISVMLMGLLGYFLLSGPTPEKVSLFRPAVITTLSCLVLFFVLFFVFVLQKKQSTVEPDADERDQIISKKAIQISSIVVCILMFFATALPMWMYGLDSLIPTIALPIINLVIFLMALTIYNAVVLILYRTKGDAA